MKTGASKASGRTKASTRKRANKHYDPAAALTDCTQEYVRLVADPFVRSHRACIPTFPSTSSLKVATWTTGTFTTQASPNLGFIGFNPGAMLANDHVGAWANGTATTYNYFTNSSASGVSPFYSNSVWDFATLSGDATFSARIVAAGLRIKWNGSILNAGGQIRLLEEPNHVNMANMGFTDMDAFDESGTFDIAPDRWYELTWHPVNPYETQYTSASTLANGTIPIMGAMVVPATVSSSIYFEAYAHFEVIGENVRGRTRSHVDMTGLSAAGNIFATQAARRPHQSSGLADDAGYAGAMLSLVGDSLVRAVAPAAEIGSKLLPIAASGIAGMVGGPLASAAAGVATKQLMKFLAPASRERTALLTASGM